ncbi:hypothetical protein FE810_04570 [Thalassotalea litorea]|uniref:Lipocalin-like domain-containing protein n=1 Tax=Thalassotalea litorea TaxID=2020715 RepID=A0A5R9IUD9_9GAMM|nr:hypothetical protein [Thalassotalea litorea]TLU66786.1 hypothetical protein FE810_04570 [Thalassotalea litorea]
MYQREQLVGVWHRSEDLGKQQFSEIAELTEDGRFVFTFYTYNLEGKLLSQISEFGDWGLVADIHFTITNSEIEHDSEYQADRTNADNYHAYRVLELTTKQFTYEHIVSGDKFTLQRVSKSDNPC